MKQKTPPPEPTGADRDAETIRRYFDFQTTTAFGKSVDELPAGERHVIKALRLFYAYRHNGFLLVEALDICTRYNVNPPTWVLVALNEGFDKFKKGVVTLEKALHMGKSHKKEYNDYREQQPLMAEVQNLINRDPKISIPAACRKVANRSAPTAEDLEKKYRRMWLGFYDYVKGK
jgi:hypothetical protein